MNNRREEYLDLVLNILLEDSIITHSNRKWWLESPWIQNNGIGRPHVGIFNYILPYTLNSTSDPFGKYCRDNYGLTDKEIYDMCRIYHDEMWERYYKLSSGKLNESVDNKKTYLDKIIKWFVDDTIIDYEKGIIIYPFSPVGPTGKPLPSFIDDLKNKLSWGMPSDVQINCRDTYGLNYDETKYIWDNYKTIIKDRYNKESIMYDLKPINESVDNKKRYLDKVVDFLVEDTKVDYEHRMIFFPFTYKRSLRQGSNNLTPFHKLLFDSYIPIDGFMEYIKELYDITSIEDITHVWETYKVIMNKIVFGDNSSPLYFNESVDKISKGEYLDKIVDYLVDDTMVDQKNKVWYPPFPTDHANPTFNHFYGLIPMTDHLELKFLIGNSYVRNFFNYCKDTYGLTDDKEIRKVWERYLKDLTPIINGIPTINESVDRKSDYLDKVVEFIVDDTKVDHIEEEITLSLGSVGVKIIYFSDFLWNTKHFLTDIPSYFSNYIKDMYGLSGDEIRYVWEQYRYIIRDKILSIMKEKYSSNNINESVDRKDEYLDKIVEFLVSDTEISNEEGDRSFKPSFTSIWFSPVYLKKMSDHMLERNFFNYCKDSYGLTNSEVNGVWGKYKKNILNIFKVPINESVDRKDNLIDKISDYMVDDTEYELSISQYNVDSTEIFVYIRYPYSAQDSGFPYTIYEVSTIKESSEYILNRVEIEYMWDVYNIRTVKTIEDIFKKYTEKLFTKIYDDMLRVKGNNINESVNRKSDYLDKVVEFMIDDTEYNIYTNTFSDHSETKVEIWFPSSDPDEGYDYSKYDVSDWLNGRGWVLDSGDDMDYVCSTYSICDINTVQELYNRYIQKLSTILYEEMSLKILK